MVNIIRDFTQKKIEEIDEIVRYYDKDDQFVFFDWVGDAMASELAIDSYMEDLETFHKSVIDKHNIDAKEFQNIIDAVVAVDTEGEIRLKEFKSRMEMLHDKFQKIKISLSPTSITTSNAKFQERLKDIDITNKIIEDYGYAEAEFKEIEKMMKEMYGFSKAEVFLLLKAQVLHSKRNSNDKSGHGFLKNIAALCTNYDGSAFRWEMTGDLATTEDAKKHFESLGLSKTEIEDLFTMMNSQHVNAIRYGKKDFAHEMVALCIFTNPLVTIKENGVHDNGKLILEAVTFGQVNQLSSIKGDIYSGRFEIDDMLSDTDVCNVFERMKNSDGSKSYWEIMLAYTTQVNNGEVNRAVELLTTYGGGDIEKGKENLIKEIESWSLGSDYISGALLNNIRDSIYISNLPWLPNFIPGADKINEFSMKELNRIMDNKEQLEQNIREELNKYLAFLEEQKNEN